MKEIVISNYTWHPLEERVWAKHIYFNGTLNETSYYISESFMQVVNSSGSYNLTYVYQQKDLIGFSENTNRNWNLLDHKGSSIGVINKSGVVIEQTFYEPYGKILTGGTTSKLDYEGEENDPTTGMIDFDARMVDPKLGIFIQPDTVIQNIYDPQTLNHYAFERNNPYKYTDEDGNEPVTATTLAISAVAIVVVFGIAGATEEAFVQLSVTGQIYSPSRVGSSFLTGALGGAILIASGVASIYWPPALEVTATLVSAYNIYNLKQSFATAETWKNSQTPISNPFGGGLPSLSNDNSYKLTDQTGNTIGSSFSSRDIQKLSSGNSIKTGGSSYKIETTPKGGKELVKVTPIKSSSPSKKSSSSKSSSSRRR